MTKPFNESFKTQIEMIQYWAALVIIGAIKGMSLQLSLSRTWLIESLADKRWYFISCFFYHKILNRLLHAFILSVILKSL